MLPSAKPTATVKSPVTALKPTWKPPVSFVGAVPVVEPSTSDHPPPIVTALSPRSVT